MKQATKRTTNEPILFATSNADADLRWFTQFDCCDPFLAFGAQGKRYALTHRLEYGRMIEEGCLDKVYLWDDVVREVKSTSGIRKPQIVDLIRYLQKQHGISSFRAPRNFPVGLYSDLRKAGARINIAKAEMFPECAVKTK